MVEETQAGLSSPSRPETPPTSTTPPGPLSTHPTPTSPLSRLWNSLSSTSPSRTRDYSDSGHALAMTESIQEDDMHSVTTENDDSAVMYSPSSSSSAAGLPRLLSHSNSGHRDRVGEPVLTRSMARGSTTTPTTSPNPARKSWYGIAALPRWAAGPTVESMPYAGGKEDEFDVLERTEFDPDQLEREGGLFDWHTPGAYPLDGEEGVVIDDEACFVDSLDGKVDFISSLPQEISLYILLHLDLEALLVTSLVSRQWRLFSLDNLLWRDLFHQQRHWRIRETPLPPPMPPFPLPLVNSAPKLKRVASSTIDGGERPLAKRTGSATSTNDHALDGTGRISRTLSDMMSDLSSLTFAPRAGPSTATVSAPSTRRRRTNSSTTSPFPALTPITSSTSTMEPSFMYNPTSSLSRTTSSTGISSLASSAILSPSRRTSSATLPPLGPVPSPSLASTPSAPLALDWPRLYRDRFLLEKRWEKNTPKTTMLRGHTDSVYCLQFDDHKVISGSRDRTIKIWDLRQGICAETLTGHAGSVLCLQYDQSILVTGSSDSRVLVWHLVGEKRFKVKMTLVGHAMGVLDLSFDDKWIVSCSKDTTIRVWDRETGELYRVLSGHRGPINAVQLLNGRVVSASGDCHLKLWDIESASVLRVFVGHERGLACVQYAPSGNLIATGAIDKVIKIWDAHSGECLQTLKGHTDLVRSLAFDEGNRRVVSASYDRTVRLWNLDTGETLHKFSMHTSWVFDVKFSTSRILSSSHDQRIIVLDFGSGLDVSQFAS